MPLPEEANLITSADLPLLGVAAEALSDVDAAAITACMGLGIDHVLSALGKRAKRPVTAIDDALKGAMVWTATHRALVLRGFTSIDEQLVVENSKATEAWLQLVSIGHREPWFTDSTPSVHEMGTLAGSTRRSDVRLTERCGGQRRRLGCGCR